MARDSEYVPIGDMFLSGRLMKPTQITGHKSLIRQRLRILRYPE